MNRPVALLTLTAAVLIAVILATGCSKLSPPQEKIAAPQYNREYKKTLSADQESNAPDITNNTAASKGQPREISGLLELDKLDDTFVIDLKYATTDNFTGKKLYALNKCIIHKNTAKKLIAANSEFRKMGFKIKIYDAYRPLSVQKILWEAASNKSFVADPHKGSIHNRGAAVDVTLVDMNGKELEMPSSFDEFSERASIHYSKCPANLIENRELLAGVLVKHGFKRISKEWWHFEDTNALNYPILDISLEAFGN